MKDGEISPLDEWPGHCSNTFSTLEVDPNTQLPEVVPYQEKEHISQITEGQKTSPRSYITAKGVWIVLIGLAIMGAIIGGSLGGTVGRRRASSTAGNLTQAPVSPEQPDPPEGPGVPVLPETDTIYPNTSLAATTFLNGDRTIYFQDFSGRVREAHYSLVDGTWSASSAFIVTDRAINGTALAVDSGYVFGRSWETLEMTGVTFVSWEKHTNRTVVNIRVRYNIQDPWAEASIPPLECGTDTKLVYKILRNRTSESDRSVRIPWNNIVYQPISNQSDGMAPILIWSDANSSALYPIRFGEIRAVEPGWAFALAIFYNFGASGSIDSPNPYGNLVLPHPEKDTKSHLGTILNLWDRSCVNQCRDEGWSYHKKYSISPYTDFAALKMGSFHNRLFFVDGDSTVHSDLSNFGDDVQLSSLQIHIPSGRFAVAADKGGNSSTEIYLYFQHNGTHLAELSYDNGYWNNTLTYIQIS